MVRLYTTSDYPQICDWLRSRALPIVPEDCLPRIGYLVEGVCASFLYQTDSCFAISDCTISNPNADSALRSACVDRVILQILKKAKELGFKYVKGETKNASMDDRGLRLGFLSTGSFSGWIKELR